MERAAPRIASLQASYNNPGLETAVLRASLSCTVLPDPIQTPSQNPPAMTREVARPSQRFHRDFLSHLNKLHNSAQYFTQPAIYALDQIKEGIATYNQLSPQQKQQLNRNLVQLNQMWDKLGPGTNNHFFRLTYHFKEKETLPQATNFRLQEESSGLAVDEETRQKLLKKHKKGIFVRFNEQGEIYAISLLQGYSIQQIRQSLEELLDVITPPGYNVRMNAHEMGIHNKDRVKFRNGDVHVHLNWVSDNHPSAVDKNIKLFIFARSIAGITDPQTHKNIVSFSDKQIAQNYLTVFHKYLTFTDENGVLRYNAGAEELIKIIEGSRYRPPTRAPRPVNQTYL